MTSLSSVKQVLLRLSDSHIRFLASYKTKQYRSAKRQLITHKTSH